MPVADYQPATVPQLPYRHKGIAGLLRRVHLWTKAVPLAPMGFVRVVLPGQAGAIALGNLVPNGSVLFVINVEGGSLRYCDSDIANPSYGELWPAGTSMQRTISNIPQVTLCADLSVAGGSNAIANISFYGLVGDD